MLKEAEAVIAIATHIFGQELVAAYLYGSAVSGGLRPRSDVDLIIVISRPMSAADRKSLATAVLKVSGRYPNPPGEPRCIAGV